MAPPQRSSSSSAFSSPSSSSSTSLSFAAAAPQAISGSSSNSSHLAASAAARLNQLSNHISMGSTAMTAAPVPSPFDVETVPKAPEDPLFGLMAAYRADTFEKKVDLGIGAYRDDNAKPWVLPVVKKAERRLFENPELNHEYLPIAGLADFTAAAQRLVVGADSPAIAEKRICSLQSISGTGALHLGAAFLAKFYQRSRGQPVYFSNPTWANHNQIFSNVKMPIATYPYFNPKTRGLDFVNMISTLQEAPSGSVVVLHACAHNPTGVDPTREQWVEIAKVIRERNHFPFFDTAYQGFASGNLAQDAWAIRYFVDQGFELCIAQSFAKNFGLYGERAGAFHFVAGKHAHANPQDATVRIASQLAILQRSEISNPPAYGARIASTVLNDPRLFSEWEENLRTMSGRIISMRKALREKLESLGTPGTWNHITDQIGMFSFTGLSEKQVLHIRQNAHVYMTKNGRISMAGLNTKNVDYVAQAFDKAVREA